MGPSKPPVILAGGEGTRLGVLTAKRTKPAVPFGGYRSMMAALLATATCLAAHRCLRIIETATDIYTGNKMRLKGNSAMGNKIHTIASEVNSG